MRMSVTDNSAGRGNGNAVVRHVVARLTMRVVATVFAAILCSGHFFSVTQAQTINREYQLKALFLHKFPLYVTWPPEAFEDESDPLVIGILGPDPVGAYLRHILAAKPSGERAIVVRNYDSISQIGKCHILFMSRHLDDSIQAEVLSQTAGRHILTTGEIPQFLALGGTLNLIVRSNRIEMEISQSAVQREQLRVSSQLLRLATLKR